jgi:hypothetical protein
MLPSGVYELSTMRIDYSFGKENGWMRGRFKNAARYFEVKDGQVCNLGFLSMSGAAKSKPNFLSNDMSKDKAFEVKESFGAEYADIWGHFCKSHPESAWITKPSFPAAFYAIPANTDKVKK